MPYPPGFKFDQVPGDRPVDHWIEDVHQSMSEEAFQEIDDGTWIGKRLESRLEETNSEEPADHIANILDDLYHSLKDQEDDEDGARAPCSSEYSQNL